MPLFGKPNIEKMKRKQDLKGLCKALGHKDNEVQSQAVNALVEIGGAAVEPLIAALAKNKLCYPAQTVLSKIGEAAVEPLIATLNNKKANSNVRAPVAWSLGEIRDKRAVEHLIAALNDTNAHVNVRHRAAESLGKIGDARAVEPLIGLLQNSDQLASMDTLTAGQITIDRMITKGKAWGHIDGKTLNNMVTSGQQMDRDIRISTKISTIIALGRIGDTKAVEALTPFLRDNDLRVRVHALEALASISQHTLQA